LSPVTARDELARLIGAVVINFNALEGALHNLVWSGIGAGPRIGGSLSRSKDAKGLGQMLGDLLTADAFGEDAQQVREILQELGANGQTAGLVERRNRIIHAVLFNYVSDEAGAVLIRLRDLLKQPEESLERAVGKEELVAVANDALQLAHRVSAISQRREP